MHELAPHELHLPFFERPTNLACIDALAKTDPLVVYLGAGLSIDRTGLSWRDLTVRLLIEKAGVQAPVAKALVDQIGATPGASAVESFLELDQDEARVALAQAIHGLIYNQGAALRGQTSQSVADLAIEYAIGGRSLTLVTTNYDNYIEHDLEKRIEFWESNIDDRLTGRTGEAELRAAADASLAALKDRSVIFLHGRLGRKEAVDTAHLPVLSERDYHETRQATFETLVDHLSSQHLLTLGASITDPPLVDALLATKATSDESKLGRWAVLPRSDFGASADSEEALATLRVVQHRLSHLGVQGVFVDQLSQVSQLIREVQSSLYYSVDSYASSGHNHSKRLERWWQDWYAGMDVNGTEHDRQQVDHRRLVEGLLPTLRRELGDTEQLKVEVWLRWNPSPTRRVLRLWASSFALFTDSHLAREVSIHEVTDGPQAALEAFRTGRPVHLADTTTKRWRSYLAAPILAENYATNFMVGAFVIASRSEQSNGCLSPDRKAKHQTVIAAAADVLRAIASNEPASGSN